MVVNFSACPPNRQHQGPTRRKPAPAPDQYQTNIGTSIGTNIGTSTGSRTMNGVLPSPKYEYEPEWRWPWWKFELLPDALFTTLHERFNTRTCPIQDPHSFLFDVRACADESPDVDTFYTKLAERRDQRALELETAWSEVCSRMRSVLHFEPICGLPECKSLEIEDRNPRRTKNDTRWARSAALSHLSRTMAFDCLVDFFDGFVRDSREKDRRRKREIKTLGRKPELAHDSASIVAGPIPPVAGDPSAGVAVRPTPPHPTARPPCPRLSPESTTSGEINAARNVPDQKDVDTESRPNPILADDTKTMSPWRHRSPPLAPEAAEQAAELAGVPQCGPPAFRHLPPGELPSPPPRKRKRDGPGSSPGGGGATSTAAGGADEQDPDVGQLAERPPAKRRATRRAAATMVEGPPRRSARIAA